MAYHERVLLAKLMPPRLSKRALARPALVQKLKGALDHRLTILQAPVGFGKSTALAGLGEAIAAPPTHAHVVWYTITEEDNDPERYFSYLIAAFHRAFPHFSDRPLAELEAIERSTGQQPWHNVIDTLINAITLATNAPIVLIEEDYHLIARTKLIAQLNERLITYMPPNMHTVITVRYPLDDPSLTAWRVRGEVLDFGPSDLSFTLDDVKTLFANLLGKPLTEDEAKLLIEKTEGFPIAVQMIGQAVMSAGNGSDGGAGRGIGDILNTPETSSSSLKALFDMLTRDLLNQLRPALRDFLRDTCVLRVLSPAACDALTGKPGTAAAILNRLSERGLFTVEVGKARQKRGSPPNAVQRLYRYHALFQEYLCTQLAPEQALKMNARAAEFYRQTGDLESALYHSKLAGDVEQAATDLEQLGESVLHAGRLDTLAGWIHELPPTVLLKHPRLHLFLGDISRMKNRFSEALAWYSHAEAVWRSRGDRAGIVLALRSKAMIHLDTMQPALGQTLLEQALSLTEGIEDQLMHAQTLELLAENKLNLGQPDEAQKLLAQAQTLKTAKSSDDALSVRVKIRTGRLQEAKDLLEAWAESEEREAITDRSHRSYRETQLLLAFAHVLFGDIDQAERRANEGLALGERLRSPFIASMAQVRLGDVAQMRWLASLALVAEPQSSQSQLFLQQEAIRAYRNAIAIGKQLGVYRVQATALRGLTRVIGMGGDVEAARVVAKEGVELGNKAGDGWISAHVEFSLGVSMAYLRHPDAVAMLTQALDGFRDFSDLFCIAAVRLWLALAYFETGQREHASAAIHETLTLSQTHGYDFLFNKVSLLGLPDVRRILPLLLQAQQNVQYTRYVGDLLAQLGLPNLEFHPGYQLRISTLGGFRVWRGAHELQSTEWQRDKARQLFQFLLVNRGRRLQREEITESLWEGSKPDAAWRDFRVALNALFKALEPNRESEAPSAYIGRDNTTYFLRPEADLWLDCAQFEQACRSNDFGRALALYQGEFLPDSAYETWAIRERERLADLHLRAAEKLAQQHIDEGQPDQAIALCERILRHDVCWENAYRLAMLAYAQQGNRAQAMRMYERCVVALRDELGVPPSREIQQLKLKLQN